MTPADEARYRARIVLECLEWVDTPYRHQASVKGAGTDCLGLVRGLWRFLKGEEPEPLPPYTSRWDDGVHHEILLNTARKYFIEKPLGEWSPGDILLFRMVPKGLAKHCGIYIGQGQFVHAYSGQAVTPSPLTSYWEKKIAGVFAFPFDQLGDEV